MARCATLTERVESGDATREWLEGRLHAALEEISARAAQIEAQERQIERLVESLEWSDEQRRAGHVEPAGPAGDRP
jgi:hypothetical protein